MTGIRRSMLLMGLTVAAVFGSLGPAHPAQAAFSDTVTAASTSIGTTTVAAPTDVTGSLVCTRQDATLSATWTLSTSTRVSGYLVSVVFSDGYVQTVQMGPADTSWSTAMSLYNATTYSMHITVTTQTDYGWTAVSLPTQEMQC